MTNQYLRNSVADHITGAISACEGIRNNLVILNGPIGCKTYYTFSGVDSVVRRSDLWSLRGELQLEDAMDAARGIVTNVQDFVVNLQKGLNL